VLMEINNVSGTGAEVAHKSLSFSDFNGGNGGNAGNSGASGAVAWRSCLNINYQFNNKNCCVVPVVVAEWLTG